MQVSVGLGRQRLATALEASDAARDAKLQEIHSLVNSAMAKQLRIAMVQAECIAGITKDPQDIAAAEQARTDYDSHMVRQALVDKVAQEAVSAPA